MSDEAHLPTASAAEERRDTITADVLTYLNRAPTSEFNGQAAQVMAHWEGADNLLWRVTAHAVGQDAVLKLYLDAGQARSRRQFDGQQTFAALGIAPRPLWYDRYPQGLSRQVLVYEWAEGQPINSANLTHVAELARAVAQVHAGDLDVMRRFSPHPLNLHTLWRVLEGSVLHSGRWLHSHSQTLAAVYQQLADSARKLVESAQPTWQAAPPAPVHGDLKLENCLFGPGTAVLLDWEMFGLGDPALDVAHFLYWNRLALEGDGRARWLDAYLSVSDQTELVERIGLIERILPFQTLCYLLDGLRNFPTVQGEQDADAQAEFATASAFLQETLQASLVEAATALRIEPQEYTESLHELFNAFMTKRIK